MGFSIPLTPADMADAELFISNLTGRLSSIDYAPVQLRQAIPPLHALTRARRLLTSIRKGQLLRFFARVRTSNLHMAEFRQFSTLVRLKSNESAAICHFTPDSLRSLIIRPHLDNSTPSALWLGRCNACP